MSFAVSPAHDLTSELPLPCEAPVCPMPSPAVTEQARVVAYRYRVVGSFDITGGRVRPFVGLGVGGVSYAGSGEVDTDLALSLAGGIRVFFGRVGLQIEVADTILPEHFVTDETEHDLQVQAGVLVRFVEANRCVCLLRRSSFFCLDRTPGSETDWHPPETARRSVC